MMKQRNERGIGFIEVLVALVILGIIAVGLLTGLAMSSRATLIADIRTNAECLASTQMESVKGQPYHPADGGVGAYQKIEDIPEGFAIYSLGRDGVQEEIVGVPWFFPLDDPEHPEGFPVEDDDDLQMIRLIIKFQDREIMQMAGVKVNR